MYGHLKAFSYGTHGHHTPVPWRVYMKKKLQEHFGEKIVIITVNN